MSELEAKIKPWLRLKTHEAPMLKRGDRVAVETFAGKRHEGLIVWMDLGEGIDPEGRFYVKSGPLLLTRGLLKFIPWKNVAEIDLIKPDEEATP